MKIDSLAEIKEQFPPLHNTNQTHRSRLSPLEKLGLLVTDHVGTMGFFFIILLWTILWLGWNIAAPQKLRFDPYPAFVLWLFISNLIQLHLLPLLMVGQNIQSKHAELRSDHDYQTNRKAEKEIETIILHLENQKELMNELLKRVENLEKKK
ncbi:MAG TPA: DUF1003 domain-containing protein [Candidatus Acidoferrales bacterium]|nr:DUF1003 domain-containing protein [Candidatus Acidoferrales bacterium]